VSTAAEEEPLPASPLAPLPEPVPEKPRKRRSIPGTILKIGVAFALIFWLWRSGAIDFAKVGGVVVSAAWLVPTLSVLFASIAIITIRWWLLLRMEKIDLSLGAALKLTLVGLFWNNVLPGAVTGDFVKMYYLGGKSPDKKAEGYATVVIDRVIGLAALIYLAFFAALTNREFVFAHQELKLTFYGNAILALGFTVGILALVLGLGRNSSFADKIRGSRLPGIEGARRGYRTLIRLGERPGILLASFALGMLSHALLVVVGIISARALGEDSLGLASYGFVVPIGLLVNSVPIGLPGGLGAGEKAFQELFLWAGAAATIGANVMLLLRLGQLIWGLVGGVIYAFDHAALAPHES